MARWRRRFTNSERGVRIDHFELVPGDALDVRIVSIHGCLRSHLRARRALAVERGDVVVLRRPALGARRF